MAIISRPASRSRLAAFVLVLLLVLAPPSGATWSIVLVDTATHEIAIGSATCLTGVDLERLLPVMLVERGAGCAQATVDSSGMNRKKMWDQLLLGTPPADIIPILLDGDFGAASRQYGIGDLSPGAAGYTGTSAKQYKNDVHGTVGTLTYAIQGNILTGAPVLELARDAVLAASGTLADRLMAGMEAARSMGGDGRCSCSIVQPMSCGSPPPSFIKSAHVGFVIVARPGDIDGDCTPTFGCATGSYWLDLNVAGQTVASPDPVFQLQDQYAAFRAGLIGHPDGLASVAYLDDDEVVGDGQSIRRLAVSLHDIDGAPLGHGGANFTLLHAPGSAGLAHLGTVADHGDGSYELQVVAGAGTGVDRLSLRVDDGGPSATIYPYPELRHRPALEATATELSVTGGAGIPLDILGPLGTQRRPFMVALSASGTVPGTVLPTGLTLPLNTDAMLHLSLQPGALGLLGGAHGFLDVLGHGNALLAPHPALLAPLVGLQVACAWFTVRPADYASNPVVVQILP